MAKKTKREILASQLEHLQYCAFSEAVAKVLTEQGSADVQSYYTTIGGCKRPNYYPSDVFISWNWQPIGDTGEGLKIGVFPSELTEEEIKQVTGTEVTIWTRIKGEEREFKFKLQHKDLQPEAYQTTIFTRYTDITNK